MISANDDFIVDHCFLSKIVHKAHLLINLCYIGRITFCFNDEIQPNIKERKKYIEIYII